MQTCNGRRSRTPWLPRSATSFAWCHPRFRTGSASTGRHTLEPSRETRPRRRSTRYFLGTGASAPFHPAHKEPTCMHRLFVRRSTIASSVLAVVTIVACQDKRMSKLDTGITRDSVLSVISQDMKPGGGVDSFPNVYTRERF